RGERALAVAGHAQHVAEALALERQLAERHVHLGVLDEQDVARRGHASLLRRCAAGSVTMNRAPAPRSDSTRMSPPERSTMRLASASPTPVPSTSPSPCSRLNISKILA